MERKISLQRIQKEVAAAYGEASTRMNKHQHKIDHIYYSNLEKNSFRRQSMEFWMSSDTLLKASHKRIKATVGDPSREQCAPSKNHPKRCQGLIGIARTLLGIIDNENTTGLSLVLEDDFVITDPGLQRMEASLALVPDDWDLIRFDCTQTDQVDFQWLNPFVVNTSTFRPKKASSCTAPGHMCWFCGGAYAMLWRRSSLHKLRSMWGRIPYDDVDCVISRTPSVRSYCVNIGVGDMYVIHAEETDIPKVGLRPQRVQDLARARMTVKLQRDHENRKEQERNRTFVLDKKL
jgi:hypothetical protein